MLRTGAKAQGANIYPPLYKIQEEKKKCVPDPQEIENPRNGEYLVSTQTCLHHKMSRMFEDEELAARFERYGKDPNNVIVCTYKQGADAASDNPQYQSDNDVDQSTIYASYLVLVCIVAENKNTGKKIHLYCNQNANSWTAVTYLRLAHEKETKGISIFYNVGYLKSAKSIKKLALSSNWTTSLCPF